MESFTLIALLGTLSTAIFGVLSFFKRFQPYALFVLGGSGMVALSVGRQDGGIWGNLFESWVTCSFIMLGVQVLLAPIALGAFIFQRSRKPHDNR